MKYKIALKGKFYEVEVENGEAMLLDEYEAKAPVQAAPAPVAAAPVQAVAPAAAAAPTAAGCNVTSPLPGNVLKIAVNNGQSVKKGDLLAVIEAMKMENEVLAPQDGVVKQIVANKGAVVKTGDVIMVI